MYCSISALTGIDPDPGNRRYSASIEAAIAERKEQILKTLDEQGVAYKLCDCVRADIGDCYADAIERYYLELWTWVDIANKYSVTTRTAQSWRDAAFRWIDSRILR